MIGFEECQVLYKPSQHYSVAQAVREKFWNVTVLSTEISICLQGEGEKVEKHTQHAPSDRHSHSHAHERSRRPASPPRWLPPNNQSHETVVNHNKRRHRSSPHRTVRKHRQTCPAGPSSHTHTRSALASTSAARPPCSPPNPQQPEQNEMTQETEGELENGYNSGDEYVPPKHPENVQEVGIFFPWSELRPYCLSRVTKLLCHD